MATFISPSERSRVAAFIEGIAERHLIKPDQDFDNAIANSDARGLPPFAITPVQGQYLTILCQLMNVKTVLEIGTLGGYSTMWFAKSGIKVTSIELEPKHRDVALENLEAAGLKDKAEIILGDANEVLPRLEKQGAKFDFVFIDADWGRVHSKYFDWGVKLCRVGGAVYVDNVVQCMMREGEEFSSGEESLLATVGRDERVKATMVPVISFHKAQGEDAFIDGFLLAIVL